MSALKLSFNHLPSHMKHCFTYCALFPKGFQLDIQKLVRFWVAQGYIETKGKGIDCFKTWRWRSFFQDVKIDGSGNMSSCRMHDLMHDLADLIAGEKIIRSSSSNSTSLKDITLRTRHMLISGDGNDDPREEDHGGDGLENASKVRTLICHRYLLQEEFEQVLNNFFGLRILVLDASTVLKSIDKLKHLRYLAIHCNIRQKLPYTITNLVNLQVLILINAWYIEEPPRHTKIFVSLKHLVLTGYEGLKLPNWLFGLVNLVEFLLKNCKRCEYLPREMHQMSSLKKLTIENCPMLKGINNDGDTSTTRSTTEEEEDSEWPQFHCLSFLCIRNCPRLTRPPTFPTVEGELDLYNASLTPLTRTMKTKSVHPSSSAALVHPLCKLTKFTLFAADGNLESLSHHDSSSCLVSLQELRVERCNRGVKLPGLLCSSIFLAKIYLRKCGTLEFLPALHELPSLRVLVIAYCPRLKGCWWKKKKKKKQQWQGNNNNDIHNDGGGVHYYNFDPSREEENEGKGG